MRLPPDVVTALPERSILKSLPEPEVEAILAFATTRRLARGAAVVTQGDSSDSLMIVLKGLLKACVVTAAGREVVLDYIGVGGLIGELGVFDGAPRSADVIAIEASEVLVLQRRDLIPYLERNTRAAVKIVMVLCERLRRTNALVEDTAALPLGPRLARGLLRLSVAHGRRSATGVGLRMSQTDIAGYVGLARENVNRQLREWQEMGLVTLSRGTVVLTNMPALEEIAECLE